MFEGRSRNCFSSSSLDDCTLRPSLSNIHFFILILVEFYKYSTLTINTMASSPPVDQPGFNMHADQGGLIIATMIMLIALSSVFVLLRLLSRRVAGAGYWVRKTLGSSTVHTKITDRNHCSGMMFWWLLLRCENYIFNMKGRRVSNCLSFSPLCHRPVT